MVCAMVGIARCPVLVKDNYGELANILHRLNIAQQCPDLRLVILVSRGCGWWVGIAEGLLYAGGVYTWHEHHKDGHLVTGSPFTQKTYFKLGLGAAG